jgi:hypothetical protein
MSQENVISSWPFQEVEYGSGLDSRIRTEPVYAGAKLKRPGFRESDTRFSTSGFFHESVSPRPPSIPLEPYWIFSKIRGDIRELLLITGVNDTGNNPTNKHMYILQSMY